MSVHLVPNGSPQQLQRLIDQVERLGLHRAMEALSPREWLIRWLATPQDELNGRKPASFLEHEDFDLILVGLLIRARTAQAWDAPGHSLSGA
jgi:hypothetical protein